MGDLDEIITTFPSPLKHKQAKQNIMGQKQQQTNKNQKKTKAQGCSEGVHMEGAGRVLPTACTGTGQAGPRSCVKWPVPPTLCKPTPGSHTSFSRLEPFQGVSLSVAPHLLSSYVPPSTFQQAVCGHQAGGHEANFGK